MSREDLQSLRQVDVADVYKFDTVVPVAFRVAARKSI